MASNLEAEIIVSVDRDTSDSDTTDSASPSGSSDAVDAQNFIDVEAEEYESSSVVSSDSGGLSESASFPRFTQLPFELQCRVWEFFCPDLTIKSRILHFKMRWNDLYAPWAGRWLFEEGMQLADYTESLRVMSSVSSSSRDIVIKRYPDTIEIDAATASGEIEDAKIRFNAARDVILLDGLDREQRLTDWSMYKKSFCDKIQNVAFNFSSRPHERPWIQAFLTAIPHVKTIYACATHYVAKQQYSLKWCGNPRYSSIRVQTYEKSYGLGEDLQWIYSWLDLSDPRNAEVAEEAVTNPDGSWVSSLDGIPFGPMVCFEFEGGAELFEKLVRRHEERDSKLRREGDDSDSDSSSNSSDSELDSSENEYESDGIDDAEIVSDDELSEDELIPNAVIHVDSGDDDRDQGSEDEESEDGNGGSIVVGGQPGLGNFSSPEPASDDDEAPDDDNDSSVIVARRPKRRIVEDSDDEDDADEDDIGAPSRKRARTGPSVVISSDDEEEDDDDEAPRAAMGQNLNIVVAPGDSDSNSDVASDAQASDASNSSEDEEEEDDQPQPQSFLQRLRQEHVAGLSAASIDYDSSDTTHTLSQGGDSQDDDEEEDDGNSLMDGMAVESDGGSDDDDAGSENW